MKRSAIAALMAAFVVPAANAEQFNIDFGTQFGIPSDVFGAASGQTGFWNSLGDAPNMVPLMDLGGKVTDVMFTDNTGNFTFSFDNPGTTGDDEALMDDILDLGGLGSTDMFTISGLSAGTYTIYSYNWAPDSDGFVTGVSVNGSPQQTVGGGWAGGYADGVTHAVFKLTIGEGEDIVINTETLDGFGSFNGLQIVPAPGALAMFGLTGLMCRRRRRDS